MDKMENNFRSKENLKDEENCNGVDGDFSLNDVEFQENIDEFVSTTGEVKTTEINEEKTNEVKTESFYMPFNSCANKDGGKNCFRNAENDANLTNQTEYNRTNVVDETDNKTILTKQCGAPEFSSGASIDCVNKKSDKKLHFVFSMLGLLLSIFYIGFPFAVTGLVMAKIKKKKGDCDELIKASVVIGYAGAAIGLFTLTIFAFCLMF